MKIRPSELDRALLCPPSIPYAAHFSRSGSFFADEGTAAHELLELCVKEGKQPWQYSGRGVHVGDTWFAFTDEMQSAVGEALDYLSDWIAYACKVQTEVSQSIPLLGNSAKGTIDIRIDSPIDGVLIADYKHGAGVAVEVEHNAQLMAYAYADAMQGDENEEITLAILQPRAGGVKEWRVKKKVIRALGPKVKEAQAKMHDTKAFNPSAKACQFCPAKGHCRALREAVFEWFERVRGVMMREGDFKMLSGETFQQLLDMSDVVSSWARGLKDAAQAHLEAGGTIPGYELQLGREGHRQWASEAAAAEKLHEILGADAYKPAEVISVAVAEKKLGKKGFRDAGFEDLVTRKLGQPTLKKVKRNSAELEFSDSIDFDFQGVV